MYTRSTLEFGLATVSAVRMVRWDQGLAISTFYLESKLVLSL